MNKELFSKFTFGFLMAQLFPGAVAVSAVSLVAGPANSGKVPEGLWSFTILSWEQMFETPTRIPLYLFLAIGAGMLIHGLNWTVLAWLENHKDGEETMSISKSFWHKCPVVLQLFVGPIKMVLEILWFLTSPGLEKLKMEENVSQIKPKYMPNFTFLQDFYLYFAQFYAHTAYALLISIPCFIVTFCGVGWTVACCVLLLVLYLATSIFFLLGRVQLTTLFKAERTLREFSKPENGRK